MKKSRRKFIKTSLVSVSGTYLVPQFINTLNAADLSSITSGKKLVIIQLAGGNDGLNTVVPFRNDRYYQLRPTLGIGKTDLLNLNDELGLNPGLGGLRKLYDQGYLSIVNGVGYPNPDRSHFRSMDIWHSASDANDYLQTGWLGRYLDSKCTANCKAHLAIEFDEQLSLALKGENIKGMAIKDINLLYKSTKGPAIRKLNDYYKKNHYHFVNENKDFLYKTLAETCSSAEYLFEHSRIHKSKKTYPNTQFARQLKKISELIHSGIETEIFYVSLPGFDTHVRQKGTQEKLLKVYGDALLAFVEDLKFNGNFKDTLILTFSEFGRRVKENASSGTDHGTANNVFVVGENLKKPGLFNSLPDLNHLDKGDLIFNTDFRNIYATLLDKWLENDSKKILGKGFSNLNFI
ncbi:DUF1501 domain-containing protein [Flexithrix dorotheae]|uniref:DUF1501 domain-containing protein n=1 Tax=Flexithrix dorotheae TaxID=70993 RepID=UPI000375E757|nr:DUF1501 domain-containing protein [Flexithrix dorotheae]